MEFVFSIMFIISFVTVLIVSFRVIRLLKEMVNSRYRNCDIYLNEDQFRDLMDILDELVRR